ncbi:hypothetical protein HYX16_00370 [Candidatus Woesearchaeota archaeon]|nr:hypothetical protein [Candidatus Woesearchaeota archaeon]
MEIKSKISLILFLLVIFSSISYALTVDLVFPVDNAVYVDSSSVIFKCKATGSELISLQLYNNVNGWSKKAEVSNPPQATEASFSIADIPNGNYLWNCKIIDGIEGIKWSNANRSFSISAAPNSPPVFSSSITSQSWNKNTNKNSVFDLDIYFSDPENRPLTFTVTGNSNININIDPGNIVSFSQPAGWFGTEKVRFIASDGSLTTQSNEVNLTVIDVASPPPSSGNNAPTFIKDIPDQDVTLDTDTWSLDLSDYAEDNEDSVRKLNWSVSDVDESLIKVEISNVDKTAEFTSKGKIGSDTIKFTVKDRGGLTASQDVNIKISNEEKNQSNETAEFDEGIQSDFTLESLLPPEKKVEVDPNLVTDFKIETTKVGDYEWYLNDILTPEKTNHFRFNSGTAGNYNLTVIVTDLLNQIINSWNITIKENTIKETIQKSEPAEPVCGNNIIEGNETCSSCPSDIKCSKNEICEEGLCREKQGFLSVTGSFVKNSFVKDLNFQKVGTIIPIVILAILLAFLVLILVIRRKNKMKYSPLDEFGEKETFIEKQQKKLREWYIKRQQKKQNKLNLRNLEGKKHREILNTAPDMIGIAGFIRENINKGYSKNSIKKVLREKGWSRLQIWRAYRRTEK